MKKAIITVIGEDKVGIIAKVSNVLADCSVNILDINQTIMQDFFTMTMLVDLASMTLEFDELMENIESLAEKIGMTIKVHREEVFRCMHRI
jgi:ACT domain-containing protein